jgi:hypothetical protein
VHVSVRESEEEEWSGSMLGAAVPVEPEPVGALPDGINLCLRFSVV